jgi:nucleoside-diphosphate-sugar epimerase
MAIGMTGSTGVLGRLLCKYLKAHNIEYKVYDNDILDKNSLLDWLGSGLDSIFHLAAVVPTAKVEKNKTHAFKVNVLGVLNLMDGLLSLGIKPWIFLASSSHVYKPINSKIKENSDTDPHNFYGFTKLQAENMGMFFSKMYGFDVCIGRIFSFYHEFQDGDYLYPSIQKRLKDEDLNNPFYLKGADNIRDISYAEDLISIMIKLEETKYSGIVNIGSGKGTSIRDFVKSIAQRDLSIINAEEGQKPNSLVADISKLNQILKDKNGHKS